MPGKTVSPRLKEIEDNFVKNGGSFKEFRIGELFEVTGTKSIDAGKLTFSDHGINFIGRTGEFNGIQGKIEKLDFAPNPANTITVTVIGYKYVKYQEEPYYCSQNVNKLTPKFELNHLRALWLMSGISKFVGQYNGQYSGYKLEQLKNAVLYVPIYTDSHIVFDYMESFIRELEMERIRELDAYLKASGLNDTELTDEEKDCLEKFEKGEVCLKEFRIGELFEIHPTKSYGYTNDKLFSSKGTVPVVVNSSQNNGIGGRVNLEPTEKRIMITFSDTTTAESIFVQDEPFIGYSHIQGLYPHQKNWSVESLLYFATLFRKNATQMKFDYANKFNRTKASNMTVSLPVRDDRIDFYTMETFIRIMEKLCIRSVIAWKNRLIETTKRVVNESAPSNT